MADIVNGYADLDEYKAYGIPDARENAPNNEVLNDIITASSRFIDAETGRTFYARTETRSFNIPEDGSRELRLDDDLLTVTTFSNGEGTEITSANYILLPANVSPKYAIKLTETSTIFWLPDSNNNTEQAIDLLGTWGYSSSTPADIHLACLEIAKSYAGRRFGDAFDTTTTITGAGVIITPRDVPSSARGTLNSYRKMT